MSLDEDSDVTLLTEFPYDYQAIHALQRRPISRSLPSHRPLHLPRYTLFTKDYPIHSTTHLTRLRLRVVAESSAIDSAVDSAIDLLKLSGEFLKRLIELEAMVEKFLNATVPTVSVVIDKATPTVKRVTQSAVDVSSTTVTAATPVVKSTVQAAKDALTERGVDVTAVQATATSAVKTASDVATSAAKSSMTFLTTTEPIVLGYYALAALGLYFFGPPLLTLAIEATRGYAGDISPAGTLDVLLSNRNAALIDIRSASKKDQSGVLDLPVAIGQRFIELEFATIKDRKLRGQLSHPAAVECRMTALQIAALRRLKRGSTVFLLDTKGSLSKPVARELERLGFRRCFVVKGGFLGWVKAKLQTKPSTTVYSAEVIQPSTIFGGTMERRVSPNHQKMLPPGERQ